MKQLISLAILIIACLGVMQAAELRDASNFTAQDIRGNTVELFAMKDKVIILDFWATWCPPCRREIPHLVDLKKTYQNKPFEIIGIALERGAVEDAIKFTTENQMNWVHIMDKAKVSKLAEDYGISVIPSTFVIKNGKILAEGLRGEELKEKIKELLK